jgi:hypothetical protein
VPPVGIDEVTITDDFSFEVPKSYHLDYRVKMESQSNPPMTCP